MIIKDLLRQIDYDNFMGDDSVCLKSLTCDSREAGEGSVFVAIKGLTDDGHRYIESAIKNGASAVLCEHIPTELESKANFITVKSPRQSMACVADIIYGKPSRDINITGVTGTNGKTSITYLLKSIYDYKKEKSGIIGTMGVLTDNERIKTHNTTPESYDIQHFLRIMVDEGVSHCFMEVSSHAIELNRIDEVSIDVGIFTNLTRDHLDFHHTMENYYQAKKKLFYKTKLNNIINIDDEYGARLYRELKQDGRPALSYGIDNDADIRASNLSTTIQGTEFDLNVEGNLIRAYIKTPGKFSVLNSMGALGAAYALGENLKDIVDGLASNSGVTGRFQILETKLGCTIILDFAHTPDGLQKVMDTINEFAEAKKIVMFGAGGERDLSRRAPMGEIAGKYCDLAILTSDNPRFENPYDICMEIAEGVKKSNGKYEIIIERDKAIYHAIDMAGPKDVVLLAGKSTEPYQDMGVEKIPYDEITIAKRMTREIEKKRGL